MSHGGQWCKRKWEGMRLVFISMFSAFFGFSFNSLNSYNPDGIWMIVGHFHTVSLKLQLLGILFNCLEYTDKEGCALIKVTNFLP